MIGVRTSLRHALSAEVAQLVEHVTENHGVGSSILPLGTNIDPGALPPDSPTRSLAQRFDASLRSSRIEERSSVSK
jgi:hypothetical protein